MSKFFYKLVPSFVVAIAKHAQITQNNKLARYLQYVKKEWRNEVLHSDKHQTFLQVDLSSFGWCG